MTRKHQKCPDCGGPFTGDHPEVGLTNEYGVHVHLDEQIAPLVSACWDLVIPTVASCQGSADERAYSFPPGSAEAFARVASTDRPEVLEAAPEDSLDLRIFEFRDSDDPLGWRWMPGYPWAGVGFSVYFPPADIPELLRRLESYR